MLRYKKIVAHDFRYDPHMSVCVCVCVCVWSCTSTSMCIFMLCCLREHRDVFFCFENMVDPTDNLKRNYNLVARNRRFNTDKIWARHGSGEFCPLPEICLSTTNVPLAEPKGSTLLVTEQLQWSPFWVITIYLSFSQTFSFKSCPLSTSLSGLPVYSILNFYS